MKLAASLVFVFLTLPISAYIQYQLLQAIHADRLLMFLFWVNLPLIIFVHVLFKIVEKES